MTKFLALGIALICAAAISMPAQSRKSRKINKPAAQTTPAVKSAPDPQPAAPGKRNGRPNGPSNHASRATAYEPTYFYEFNRPGFTFSPILIEHDPAGKGKVSFKRDGSDELFTDPLELSPATIERINSALTSLDFLNSSENYQTARDYSTMGNMTFRYKKGGHERTVKYNWTENKDAKALMDEYRHIANEYTWKFDITIARENQPLQTPGLMDEMDSYLSRGEISDPPHLIAFLAELSNDERMPLIARNHAGKLVSRIQKDRK